jgi:hypothetical protein
VDLSPAERRMLLVAARNARLEIPERIYRFSARKSGCVTYLHRPDFQL